MIDYITSDLHFYHEKIIQLAKRPFFSAHYMNGALIENWNATVKPENTILILGDLALTRRLDLLEPIFKQLNGKKLLVPGNHDVWMKHKVLLDYFTPLEPIIKFIKKRPDDHAQGIVASHYPLLTWPGAHRGAWMLHGHCHGNVDALNESTTRLDVGIETAFKLLGAYRPFSWAEVCEILGKRVYVPVDHHT